jgi:hypothetical protein
VTPRAAVSLTLLVVSGCSFGGFDYLSASYGESNTAGTAGNSAAAGSAAAGSAAAGSASAGSASAELDGDYQLVAAHSSKCMATDGALTPAGNVSMQQLGCAESTTQAFTLRKGPDDAYSLVVAGSDDCVDVEGASREAGARVIRSPCKSEPSQRWRPTERDVGRYAFENALSGKCLDVAGSGAEDHVVLDQWTCQDAPNQNWVLASLTALPLPLAVDDAFWSMPLNGPDNPRTVIAPNELGGSRDCEGLRAPSTRGFCHSAYVEAFPPAPGTAGGSWLHPARNQGTFPGRRIVTGAVRVSFQARGEHGGEVVTFGAGGNLEGTFQDSFAASTTPLTLSTEWQSLSVDLTAVAYSSVIVGFYWRMETAANVAPFQIYIDDVVWE